MDFESPLAGSENVRPQNNSIFQIESNVQNKVKRANNIQLMLKPCQILYPFPQMSRNIIKYNTNFIELGNRLLTFSREKRSAGC